MSFRVQAPHNNDLGFCFENSFPEDNWQRKLLDAFRSLKQFFSEIKQKFERFCFPKSEGECEYHEYINHLIGPFPASVAGYSQGVKKVFKCNKEISKIQHSVERLD